jgi:hypothetical protein
MVFIFNNINIKINKLFTNVRSSIGFATSFDRPFVSYLGFGSDQWGMCLDGGYMVNANYTKLMDGFKEGDTITFFGDNGIIRVRKNNIFNDYSHNFGTADLYFGATLGDYSSEYEIVETLITLASEKKR